MKNYTRFYFFISFLLLAQSLFSQVEINEINEKTAKAINEQIFDTSSFPKTFTIQSNKYYRKPNGNIKTEIRQHPDSSTVRVEYDNNENVSLIEVGRKGRKPERFTYEYSADGNRIMKERGIYDLDYFYTDEGNYYGINVFENAIGINRYLDTIFIHDTENTYEQRRKLLLKNRP